MSGAGDASSYMRVFSLDGSWATLPVRDNTTCQQIADMLCRKKNIPANDAADYALFVSDTTNDRNASPHTYTYTYTYTNAAHFLMLCCASDSFERRLDAAEFPLEIQEVVRKHGQVDNFKFVFKHGGHKHDAKQSGERGTSPRVHCTPVAPASPSAHC
jgi:hypothetical protein